MATSDFDKPFPAPPSAAKRTDTLAMVKKLRDAGVPQQQAEAEAEVISDTAERVEDTVREEFVPKSAIREDLVALEARLDKRMTEMEARLEKRISQQDVNMSQMEARIMRAVMTAVVGGMAGTIVGVAAIVTLIIKILFADPS